MANLSYELRIAFSHKLLYTLRPLNMAK